MGQQETFRRPALAKVRRSRLPPPGARRRRRVSSAGRTTPERGSPSVHSEQRLSPATLRAGPARPLASSPSSACSPWVRRSAAAARNSAWRRARASPRSTLPCAPSLSPSSRRRVSSARPQSRRPPSVSSPETRTSPSRRARAPARRSPSSSRWWRSWRAPSPPSASTRWALSSSLPRASSPSKSTTSPFRFSPPYPASLRPCSSSAARTPPRTRAPSPRPARWRSSEPR